MSGTPPRALRAAGRLLLAGVLAAAGWALPARAEPLADVQRLYYGGQAAEALKRVDAALADDPSDPPLRFMKGVMLADAKRGGEALAIFEKLASDYPDLAEPYNNLAALYAETGLYEKARAALEQALRVNPNYATAYENLGDVYAALSAQAYARALRLDPKAASVGPKLERLRRSAGSDARSGAEAPPPAATAAPSS